MDQINLKQIYERVQSEICNGNYRSAIEEAAGLVALARLVDDKRHILLGKYFLGLSYYNLYDYQSSMDKYMELANMVLSKEISLDALNLDKVFFDQVRYGMALDMYNLGDLDGGSIILGHILENTEDAEVFLDSIILLGVINLKMYELSEDLNYIIPTLEMYLPLLEDVILPRQKQVMIYNNLSTLFTFQGEYQQAQEMLNNSIIKANSPEEMVFIYNEMARINLKIKRIEKAQKNLEKAEEYLGKCANPGEKGYHYFVRGLYHLAIEQNTEAQRFLEKSLYLARITSNLMEQISICSELAVLYEKMGHGRESEYFQEQKELKEKLNLVNEIICWQDFWPDSKSRLFQNVPWKNSIEESIEL